MLKYLIIQLSDASTSFCHYSIPSEAGRVMDVLALRSALVFSMKENLQPHFLMPDYQLSVEIESEIEKHDSVIISSFRSFYASKASIIVYDSVDSYNDSSPASEKIDLILLSVKDVSSLSKIDYIRMARSPRINIVLQGIEGTKYSEGFVSYKTALNALSTKIESLYKTGGETQVNILTDILFNKGMGNCNAGVESITVAPNGKLYLCPAFYINNPKASIGTPDSGINIKNQQLLRLDHAPICSRCDAFHCHRCVWLNELLTNELNTPSRQQCVLSHLERNQSRKLLGHIRKVDPSFANGTVLKKISYLDPIELINR